MSFNITHLFSIFIVFIFISVFGSILYTDSEKLLKTLNSSWGQSKMLELSFLDYVAAQKDLKVSME